MSAVKLALSIALLSFAAVTTASSAAAADLIWGVNGHPFTAYPGISFERQLDHVKDLGVKSYRVDISDANMAPLLAKLVTEAKARGIEILPVVTPRLNLEKETPQDLYKKAYDLAVSLVSRFKNDIRVWELGNEMENYALIHPCEVRDNGTRYPCEWGPAGGVTALDYYGPRWTKVSAVLKGLSEGTIAVDPTIRKAMGTAGWGHTGAFARMQHDGIQWDITVWHMYGQDPEWAFKILSGLDRPIWVTEFNHAGGSQSGEQEQVDGLIRTMTRLRQLQRTYDIEAAHIYELLDEPYWAPSYEASMGLVRVVKNGAGRWVVGAPKPAFEAVKQAIGLANSLEFLTSDCHLNEANKLDSGRAMRLSYIYCLVLGRTIDGAGLETWMASLKRGTSLQQLLLALLESDEFKHKHNVSKLTNSDFVVLMYRLLLGRDPDGMGFSTYFSRLEDGSLSRSDLQTALVRSTEFTLRHPILHWTGSS